MEKECFIDIHCHLDFCKDVNGVVDRARDAGVGIILSAGVNRKTNREVLKLCEKHDIVKAGLGIYPIDALSMTDKEIDNEIAEIIKNRSNVTAIGEVGIDFKEDSKEHERQKKNFEKFIDLALELNKPIIVHSRKAEREAIEILEEKKVKKVIMHCFCGKKSLVERIVKNGWFLTIPTSVKNSLQFQDNAKSVSLSQLFCETDSPYLHPDKKGDNEPANVIVSYEMIAKMKGISLVEAKKAIFENYKKLF